MTDTYDRIKALADELHLSIHGLEMNCGLYNGAISRIKYNPEQKIPNRVLVVVAKELNTTVEYLLTGNGEPHPTRPVTEVDVAYERLGGKSAFRTRGRMLATHRRNSVIRDPLESMLLSIYRGLSDSDKKKLIAEAYRLSTSKNKKTNV